MPIKKLIPTKHTVLYSRLPFGAFFIGYGGCLESYTPYPYQK